MPLLYSLLSIRRSTKLPKTQPDLGRSYDAVVADPNPCRRKSALRRSGARCRCTSSSCCGRPLTPGPPAACDRCVQVPSPVARGHAGTQRGVKRTEGTGNSASPPRCQGETACCHLQSWAPLPALIFVVALPLRPCGLPRAGNARGTSRRVARGPVGPKGPSAAIVAPERARSEKRSVTQTVTRPMKSALFFVSAY